jgi:hypothetical protein
MRILGIVALSAALAGCAASREEVAVRLGSQYVGQNVDALVVKFGPPASTFQNAQRRHVLHLAAGQPNKHQY